MRAAADLHHVLTEFHPAELPAQPAEGKRGATISPLPFAGNFTVVQNVTTRVD